MHFMCGMDGVSVVLISSMGCEGAHSKPHTDTTWYLVELLLQFWECICARLKGDRVGRAVRCSPSCNTGE